MADDWILHLSLDPVPVHKVLELFVMFNHLVSTEDDVFVDFLVFFHYPWVIRFSPGDITSPGMI